MFTVRWPELLMSDSVRAWNCAKMVLFWPLVLPGWPIFQETIVVVTRMAESEWHLWKLHPNAARHFPASRLGSVGQFLTLGASLMWSFHCILSTLPFLVCLDSGTGFLGTHCLNRCFLGRGTLVVSISASHSEKSFCDVLPAGLRDTLWFRCL